MNPYVIAVTGASAQQLAERSIELLLKNDYYVHLILSKGAYEVWKSELGINIPGDSIAQEIFWRERLKVRTGRLKCLRWNENSSEIASGSFHTNGMLIVPCTMGTIGRIASGISQNLIERCADVHLKESRPLILVPRETPFNLIHLRNLTSLAEAGAKIIPPIPAWYIKPKKIEEIIDFIVLKIFDSLSLNLVDIKRWEGPIK